VTDPAPDAATDIALARALDDLRRGEIIRVTDGARGLDLLAAELATPQRLAQLESAGRADLLITPERAETLKILNQRAAAGADVIAITRMPWHDLATSLATADPVDDLATPLKGPFPTRELGADTRAAEAGLALAKRAALLPALFAVPADGPVPDRLVADASAILAWRRAARLQIISIARLPLEGAEDTSVVAFRPTDGGPEHLALLIGTPGDTPLIRLHSACLTGDVLGSLKCDCGPQLRAAVRRIAESGGILLYLQQEGRGIGLLNKLRAYQLQDQGFDTVDANLRLGFAEDERDFDLAAAMLKALGVARVRLLSNNPLKSSALEGQGIEVVELVPHSFGENPHNSRYLETKRDRQGHRF
jgi:GTP cyclohydrolase II